MIGFGGHLRAGARALTSLRMLAIRFVGSNGYLSYQGSLTMRKKLVRVGFPELRFESWIAISGKRNLPNPWIPDC
jgi:hypothetical protein